MEDTGQPRDAASGVRPRRVHLNRESAEALISQWEASGLSAAAFCQDRPVSTATLQRWHARLRPGGGGLARVVRVDEPRRGAADVRLRVCAPGGLQVELCGSVDEALVRVVCRALSC